MTMEDQTIEVRVKKVVADVFRKDADQISRETKLIEDLYAKSLNIIELAAVLEDEFNIEISGQEARSNKTVGQTIDMVKRLVGK